MAQNDDSADFDRINKNEKIDEARSGFLTPTSSKNLATIYEIIIKNHLKIVTKYSNTVNFNTIDID